MNAFLPGTTQGTVRLLGVMCFVGVLLAIPFVFSESRDSRYPWSDEFCFVKVRLIPQEGSIDALSSFIEGIGDIVRNDGSRIFALTPFGVSGLLFHMPGPCEGAKQSVHLLIEEVRSDMPRARRAALPHFEVLPEQATKSELVCGKGMDESDCPNARNRARMWGEQLLEYHRNGN